MEKEVKYELVVLRTNELILSNEKLESGNTYLTADYNTVGVVYSNQLVNDYNNSNYKKVIAGAYGLPKIDFNNLECEFGLYNIEEIAYKYYGYKLDSEKLKIFADGFTEHRVIDGKDLTIDDGFNIFQAGMDYEKEGGILQPDAHGFIYPLLKPIFYNIDVEIMKDCIKILNRI